MKMQIAPLTVLAISILAIIMVTPIHATFIPNIYARTDKSSYLPGDTGTLFLTVRNTGTQSFAVKNISITYPWKAFITDHWEGNTTTIPSPTPALAGTPSIGTYNTQFSFTVPTDGRASFLLGGETILIHIGTDIGTQGSFIDGEAAISIAAATYQPLGLASSGLQIVSLVLLAIAVVMLALVYLGIRKQSKK